MTEIKIGRRQLLRAAGGAGLAVMGMPLLEACGGGGADGGGPAGSTTAGSSTSGPTTAAPSESVGATTASNKLALPAHVTYPGVQTDMPETPEGGLAGYLSYPRPPVDSITEAPGTGGTVTAFSGSELPVPPALGGNAFWQYLNKVLGVNFKINIVTSATNNQKLATLVAGGDLPDLLSMPPTGQPRLPEMLKAQFADLTEFLSGDAVKSYPMLANLPSGSWKSAVFDNRIYAIPTMNAPVTPYMVMRADILEAKGLDPSPANADDFLKLCVALTDEGKNRYAVSLPMTLLNSFVGEMFGAPNIWRVEDGKFTSAWATDEYKDALAFVAKMWSSHVFQPDSLTATPVTARGWFGAGTISMFVQGGIGYWTFLTQYEPTTPGFALAFVPAPKADGRGIAKKHLGSGVNRMCVIPKKTGKDKIAELLRILNYLAAPFGTAEYLDVRYGAEGTDWTWESGGGADNPTPTSRGTKERIQTAYLSGPPFVLFTPGYPDSTKAAYAYMKEAAATGEPLPTVGLHSDTDDTKGGALSKSLNDLANDIIAGRKPITAWDAGVATWRKSGGDQIATEYGQALAESTA